MSKAVAPRRVTCGIDMSGEGGPLILVAGPSLQACPAEDLAAAFALLFSNNAVRSRNLASDTDSFERCKLIVVIQRCVKVPECGS